MKTEDTNLLLLTISAFWSSSRWPKKDELQKADKYPLGGRYTQVSLYYYNLFAVEHGILTKL